jgi:hypothetical protein
VSALRAFAVAAAVAATSPSPSGRAGRPGIVVRGTAHNCPRCDDAMECDCASTIAVGPLAPPGMAPLYALLDGRA